MEHILPILSEHKDKPWLIVGKGPSYDVAKVRAFNGMVCCLNETSNDVAADLTLMNDWRVLKKLQFPRSVKWYALAVGRHHFVTPEENNLQFTADIAGSLTAIEPRLFGFDLRTCCHQYYPLYPVIMAYNSVYESAIWLLGYAGVKNIFTTGIDGGTTYHERFGARDPGYEGVDLSCQFKNVELPIKIFEMKVERS